MKYDSFCMAATVEELRAGFVGASLDQVYQPEPLQVVLAFTGRGRRRFWLLDCDPRTPRAHELSRRPPSPDAPPAFCMLLRKHLKGARLADAEQVRFDRLLRLTFRRGQEQRILLHEPMGRHANLVLTDAEGQILGAIRSVPDRPGARPVLPGLPYREPPGARPDPRALDREALRERLRDAREPADLTRTLSGWGTFAAREAFARAAAAGEGGPEALAAVVFEMMERVRAGAFRPTLFEDERGRPKGVWAFPSVQEGWTRGRSFGTISAACEAYYDFARAEAETEARRAILLGALERASKTAAVQLAEARAALEGREEAEQLRISGELLSAHVGRVERGAAAVDLPNWYDPEGRPLHIPLDPALSPRENAERYFHRYRRATAAAERAESRRPVLEARARELAAWKEEAASAGPERLAELLEIARREGWLRQAPAPGARPQPEPEFPPGIRIRRVPIAEWEVLYGENAPSNDYLTVRVARPDDLWLHARAASGSHVVVRNVRSLDRLPPEVLREAARLAARQSEARHAGIVPVDYTFRRYVRKPRGSAAGAVTYTHEKTLYVEPR